MGYNPRVDVKERQRLAVMQREIRDRTSYSLALLGMSCVYHGGGRFLNIRPPKEDFIYAEKQASKRRANANYLENRV